MLNRIKDVLMTALAKGKATVASTEKPIKHVVIAYFALVVVLVFTYYAAWVYLFLEDKTTLSDLLAIIQETVGASMIGFVTFIAGCFVDLNKNNIPDQFEEQERDRGARSRF